ncbi:hypothetical protein [Ruminococcus sp.]
MYNKVTLFFSSIEEAERACTAVKKLLPEIKSAEVRASSGIPTHEQTADRLAVPFSLINNTAMFMPQFSGIDEPVKTYPVIPASAEIVCLIKDTDTARSVMTSLGGFAVETPEET